MKLIINADDFGKNKMLNERVLELHKRGIIKSATILANGDAFDDAVKIARVNNKLGVGVHLNLTEGKSLTGLPEVLTMEGNFIRGKFYAPILKLIFPKIYGLRKEEIKEEFRAQIEKVLKCKIEITHIDTHHHIIVFPIVFEVIKELCMEYHIKKIRFPIESFKFGRNMLNYIGISFFAKLIKKRFEDSDLTSPRHFIGLARLREISVQDIEGFILKLNKDKCSGEIGVHLDSDFDYNALKEFGIKHKLELSNKVVGSRGSVDNTYVRDKSVRSDLENFDILISYAQL